MVNILPPADMLEPLLAGTQCTQCGYPSCRGYAEAISSGAEPNLSKCRPGGSHTAYTLAMACNRPSQPLFQQPLPPRVAHINAQTCIGCTKCLQICPTDAIFGAPKQQHGVVTGLCTGCGLCAPVCPVNVKLPQTPCITLPAAPPGHTLTLPEPTGSLTRSAMKATWELVHARNARRSQTKQRSTSAVQRAQAAPPAAQLPPELQAKIAAARGQANTKYTVQTNIQPPKLLSGKKTKKFPY